MNKINLTLNISKINKDKIFDRTYKDKDGKEITEKNYKVDVVELKERKFVTEGETWKLFKTHFVAESQTKQERDEKAYPNYVGEGFQFENKLTDPDTGIDTSEIPF